MLNAWHQCMPTAASGQRRPKNFNDLCEIAHQLAPLGGRRELRVARRLGLGAWPPGFRVESTHAAVGGRGVAAADGHLVLGVVNRKCRAAKCPEPLQVLARERGRRLASGPQGRRGPLAQHTVRLQDRVRMSVSPELMKNSMTMP